MAIYRNRSLLRPEVEGMAIGTRDIGEQSHLASLLLCIQPGRTRSPDSQTDRQTDRQTWRSTYCLQPSKRQQQHSTKPPPTLLDLDSTLEQNCALPSTAPAPTTTTNLDLGRCSSTWVNAWLLGAVLCLAVLRSNSPPRPHPHPPSTFQASPACHWAQVFSLSLALKPSPQSHLSLRRLVLSPISRFQPAYSTLPRRDDISFILPNKRIL
ncbi:hypothetical protein BJ170DRAFT_258883 [Xylariales sp. AK1849]|nr:hypothetical protein BJ170DRAFT_258883 [Xylariales sp. AK1849]